MMKNSVSLALQEIEEALPVYFQALEGNTDPVLLDAMKYAVNGGGKRVRPVLMLFAADAADIPRKRILPLACALECIHNYSLIHDDLPCMDNDDLRRGRPTVHKVYGEAIAMLAGDALLNLGHEILLEACIKDSALVPAAYAISRAAGVRGMVGGQSAEFTIRNPDKKELIHIDTLKTGALIQAAVTVPYIAANSPYLHDIERLGLAIGFVFQLVDDLLDFRAGGDKGKTTFPSLYGEEDTLEEIAKQNRICQSIFDKLSTASAGRLENLREYTETLSHRLI
jgi:geranylgeranyl diphosphate synthase type II